MRTTSAILICGLFCTLPLAARDAQSVRRTPVVEAMELVGPAVVNITARSTRTFVRPIDPFGLFGELGQRSSESLGSGVIVDPQGYVVTNTHVIEGAREVVVITQDGVEHRATIVGVERSYDLAVLKIEGERSFPAVKIAYHADPWIGETVIAIGNPYGLNNTVTTGVVSALHRTVEAPWGDKLTGLIQTDASINRGNSGGPLVNILGELIGINTSIISESGGSQGIGFAVSARRIQRMYEQYVLNYLSLEARTGLEVITNDARMARQYQIPNIEGVAVWEVVSRGYGDRSGVQPGDIITHVNGQACKTPAEYSRALDSLSEDTGTFTLTVVRREAGETEELTLQTRPEEAKVTDAPLQIRWRGMIVEPLTPRMATQLNLATNDGVHVRAVVRDSRAYLLGVRPDDVIYEVEGGAVPDMQAFHDVSRRTGELESVHIRVKRPQAYGGALLYHGSL